VTLLDVRGLHRSFYGIRHHQPAARGGWYDDGDGELGLLFAALAVPAYLLLENAP
jgi:hypothetical protein